MRFPSLLAATLGVLALLSVPAALTQVAGGGGGGVGGTAGGGGGGSAGVSFPFGSVVSKGDADATAILASAFGAGFCFSDDDGSGAFGAGEPAYLQLDACGTVSWGAVRIANPPTGGRGSQVRSVDVDFATPSSPFGGGLDFFDADGDGFLNPGETAYVDSDGSGTVSVGDVVLTGPSAGTVVTGSSPGRNNPLAGSLVLAAAFQDFDGDGFLGVGDVLVLDDPNGFGTGAGLLSAGDLGVSGPLFGTMVAAGERALTVWGTADFCYVDGDGSGTFGANEPAYLAMAGCGVVSSGDVRLANAGGAPGSLVAFSSSDFGQPTVNFDGGFAYVDANGDATLNPDEAVYLDSDDSGDASAGDLILSGGSAGSTVTATSAALGQPFLATLLPGPYFWDADTDGAFGAGDVFYADDPNGSGTGAGLATVGDLIIGGSGFGTVVDGGTYALTQAPDAALCFADPDGAGGFEPSDGEALYLGVGGCSAVAPNDLRLANTPAGDAGSRVLASDPDVGTAVLALASDVAFFDADGDAAFAPSETAYLDSDGSGDVSVGDVVLSGASAGSVAGAASPGLHNALQPMFPVPAFWDGDLDGRFTRGDRFYLDDPNFSENGYLVASVSDLRVSGPEAASSSTATSTSTGTGTTSSTSTGTGSTTSTTSSSTTTTTSSTSTDTGSAGSGGGSGGDSGSGSDGEFWAQFYGAAGGDSTSSSSSSTSATRAPPPARHDSESSTTTAQSTTSTTSASDTTTTAESQASSSSLLPEADVDPFAGIHFPVSQERLDRPASPSRASPAPMAALVALGLLALASRRR